MTFNLNTTSQREKLALAMSPLATSIIVYLLLIFLESRSWVVDVFVAFTLAITYASTLLLYFMIIKPLKKKYVLNVVTLVFIAIISGFFISIITVLFLFSGNTSALLPFGVYGSIIAFITSVIFGLIAGYRGI